MIRESLTISVIIPVVNPPIERFRACLDSILAQNYRNWEMIIVNDGSDDPVLLEALSDIAHSDTRVRVHNQKNAGPGHARNVGTHLATGDYVTFVDADDELPPYVFSNVAEILQRDRVDLVLGYVQPVVQDRDKTDRQGRGHRFLSIEEVHSLFDFTLAGVDEFEIARTPWGTLKNGPVARFLAAPFAKELQFPVQFSVSEDTIWNLKLFSRAKSVVVSHSIWYWYWVSHGSTSRGFKHDAPNQALAFFSSLKEALGDRLVSDRDRALAISRVATEVHRASRTFYAHPHAGLSLAEQVHYARILFRASPLTRNAPLVAIMRLGLKPFVKYLLCASGAAPLAWRLRRQVMS